MAYLSVNLKPSRWDIGRIHEQRNIKDAELGMMEPRKFEITYGDELKITT